MKSIPVPQIKVYETAENLNDALYRYLMQIVETEGTPNRPLHIALAGGSTPRAFYAFLARRPAGEVPWQHIHLWWGDERCVPADDPQSNYRMVRETLIDHILIPVENVHRVKGESDPDSEAIRYAEEMKETMCSAANEKPVFDLLLLGIGDDGHTASLFPQADMGENTDDWCLVARHPQSGQKRITMSLPVLNQARHIVFMVTGPAKADMVARILKTPEQNKTLPASRVFPHAGTLSWFLDRHAAAGLDD